MTNKKKKQLTIRGESVDIVERLSEVTGLTPRHVVELLLRKYGKELEMWMGMPVTLSITPHASEREISQDITTQTVNISPSKSSPLPTPSQSIPSTAANNYPEPPLELPTDPGTGLKPIQL